MDYIVLAIPVFFILIGIEFIYGVIKNVNYYRFNDSINNLSLGIGSQIVGLFFKSALFFGYQYLYDHLRIFDFPQTIWTWLILFIGVDFFYYWFHRFSHQINALWAAHIVHHQSEEYNLTVALRQSWFQGWFSWIFYLPLAILGFSPLMFITLSAFNTLYQFWIHTRLIKKIGFLEYIINTPSHHRVHHGSNPKYIDKNHGGTLIIWDIFFGTFQKEEEEVYYGITKPLSSWNPLWANFHYWVDLWEVSKRSKGFNKVKMFFSPPGWYPVELGGRKYPTEINPQVYRKYDPAYSRPILYYIAFQFIIILIGTSFFLFNVRKFDSLEKLSLSTFIIFSLVCLGALLEQKKWGKTLEIFRLVLMLVLILYIYFAKN
ncbi:MAG: sterol desaturase family protein [Pedobacter sp.]|nr:MAG: sterol desaturase family protein [Pedobacter sp.]